VRQPVAPVYIPLLLPLPFACVILRHNENSERKSYETL
jgi:hypothetical protein